MRLSKFMILLHINSWICFLLAICDMDAIVSAQILAQPKTVLDDAEHQKEDGDSHKDYFSDKEDSINDVHTTQDYEQNAIDSIMYESDDVENLLNAEMDSLKIWLISEYLELLPYEQYVLYKLFLSNIKRNTSNLILDDYV